MRPNIFPSARLSPPSGSSRLNELARPRLHCRPGYAASLSNPPQSPLIVPRLNLKFNSPLFNNLRKYSFRFRY
jgi:hypothetical protein